MKTSDVKIYIIHRKDNNYSPIILSRNDITLYTVKKINKDIYFYFFSTPKFFGIENTLSEHITQLTNEWKKKVKF